MSHHDANMANLKFFQDSLARQEAEMRALNKFKVQPIDGTREHRLRQQVAAELAGTAPPAPPPERRVLSALHPFYKLMTADAVATAMAESSIERAQPVRLMPPTATTASTPVDVQANPDHVRAAILYGDKFLAHLRKTNVQACIAAEAELLDLQLAGDDQPTADRRALWNCLKPQPMTARDCYARSLNVHAASLAAVRAGHMTGKAPSLGEIFLSLYTQQPHAVGGAV